MNVKNSCRRENNTNHEDHSGIHLSRIQCLPLSSCSESAPGNVRWCPSLAIGSLFETTSNPQSVAVSFRFGCSPLFCPAGSLSTQGPGVLHLMTPEDYQYLLHLPPEGSSGVIRRVAMLSHPQGALFSLQGRQWECFPVPLLHILVCPKFLPMMYGFW